MRIVLVNIHYAPLSYGGATIVVEEHAKRLMHLGHEVLVIAGTEDPSMNRHQLYRYEVDGVPVVAVKLGPFKENSEAFFNPEAGECVSRILAAFQPDVVHLHAIQGLGVSISAVAKAQGARVVVTMHDAWWFCDQQFMVRPTGEFCGQFAIDTDICATCIADQKWRIERARIANSALTHVDHVLVPSDFWRSFVISNGLAPSIVSTNRNGIRLPAAGWSRTPHSGPVRFGFIGGLGPIKGSMLIVEAFNRLPYSNYEVRVVDATLNLGFSSMSVDDWPIPGRLTIVPAYTQSHLDEFFDSIDVLLFPSQWKESFGLTVREASARGVFVICTDGGGQSEDLVDGDNATFIPISNDASHLARAIEAVLSQERSSLGPAVPSKSIRGYQEQVEELIRVYESLVDQNSVSTTVEG